MATTYMNKVYVIGGYRGDGRVKNIEYYNEEKNKWELFPLLLLHSIEAGCLLHLSHKEIVLLGGKDDQGDVNYVMVYEFDRRIYKTEKSMLIKRVLGKAGKYNGRVYIIGGASNNPCEMATIGLWEWQAFPTYPSFGDFNITRSSYAQSL